MKIIDLLNKIANGEEVPYKIKVKNYFLLTRTKCDNFLKYYIDEDGGFLFTNYSYELNDEVEIIEPQEHKIPDKIFLNQTDGSCYIDPYSYKQVPLKREKLSPEEISIINKINEIIDYLEVNNDRNINK